MHEGFSSGLLLYCSEKTTRCWGDFPFWMNNFLKQAYWESVLMFLIYVGIFELPVQSPDWGWHGEEEYECHIIYRSLFMKVPSQQQGHRGQTRDVIQSPSTDGHIEMNRTTLLVRDFPSRMNDLPAWTVRERSNLRDVGGSRCRRAPAPPRRTRAYLFTACFALIS